MSEQGAKPEVLPGDLITGPGLYETRCLDIVPITGWKDGWWITECDGTLDWYGSDGHRRFYEGPDPDHWQLLHWVGPLPATEPEPKTTSEQLAEIEGQAQPEPPEPQPKPVQVREGRWRTRAGDIRNVTPTPPSDGRAAGFPWWDSAYQATWTSDGRYLFGEANQRDLIEYLGPIEQQPQPVPQRESDAEMRVKLLKHANDSQAETIGRLQAAINERAELGGADQTRAELQGRIGELERQLLQRDARIRDLETMHAAATQAVVDAGKANDKLRNLANNLRQQFEAAANEISEQRSYLDKYDKQLDQKDAQIRDLRIELDAAQQVPQPVDDDERERIWDQATEQAGRQVVQWLRPLTLALHRQPDERFSRFMVLTLSVLPDVLPELLGYAVEDEAEADCEE